jgi:hypothetical protein
MGKGSGGVPTTQSYLLMTNLADTNGLYIHATNQISKKWETRELIMGYRPQAVQEWLHMNEVKWEIS